MSLEDPAAWWDGNQTTKIYCTIHFTMTWYWMKGQFGKTNWEITLKYRPNTGVSPNMHGVLYWLCWQRVFLINVVILCNILVLFKSKKTNWGEIAAIAAALKCCKVVTGVTLYHVTSLKTLHSSQYITIIHRNTCILMHNEKLKVT